MIQRVRRLWRRARGVRSLRPIFEAGDRMWWAWTIRRSGLLDRELVAAQGFRRSSRAAIRRYVRGGFREGMVINPLIQERLVASQLSDVGRVPALYAYLVNDPRRIETSVAWDARAEAHDPASLQDPGGPVGHALRAAERAGKIDLRGTTVTWERFRSTVVRAAGRSTQPPHHSRLDVAGEVILVRIAPDEDAASPLRVARRLADGVHDGDIIIALGSNADHWVSAALLTLRSARVHVVADDDDVVHFLSEHPGVTALAVRGGYADIGAEGLRSLLSSARTHSRVSPLWLDSNDGTIVSAGVGFFGDEAFDILHGHPPEDASNLASITRVPASRGTTFAVNTETADVDDEIVRADVVVRAPWTSSAEPSRTAGANATDVYARAGFGRLDFSRLPPRIVRDRSVVTLIDGESTPSLRWALKIAAPPGSRGEWWGDTHFARGLAAALRRLGQEVVIDAYAARERPSAYLDDVVVALRGPEPLAPQPGAVSIMWIISHPDEITASEISGFDAVFAASGSWARAATERFGIPIAPLLQCTDSALFRPSGAPHDQGLLFVGTARGIPRPSIIEPLRAGVPVRVYGPDWSGWIPGSAIIDTGVPHADLPEMYERATAVLNDHWPAMQRAGFISNRLFDVVAAGGRAISDRVSGVDELFRGSVVTYGSIDELLDLVGGDVDALFPSEERQLENSAHVRSHHSFDARARSLLDVALRR